LAGALLALLPLGAWAADPQITSMTDTPDPATAGGLYTYAVGIDNTDAGDATNTVLTLGVPSGATFVSASPANANCVATSATLVTCSVGTLAGNGTGARTVNFTWRATAAGTINATATITADSDTNLGNNTQGATTTVLAGADLRLTKTDSPDPVIGGANVTYTLTAFNDGPNASGNLVLTDNLPGSSTFVSASGTGWSCSHAAGVVTCTRNAPLAVGASAPPVTIVARIIASTGFVTNSATISPAVGAVADPDSNNNTATATTQVLPGADVRIDSKSVSPNPVIAGENATFTITPRNGGPAVANNVVVTDTLPSGWTFVSATGTGWSCSASGQTVSCSRATYAVGATNNITIVATAPTNAVIGPAGRTDTNTASISTTDNDPNPGNNSRAVTFDILPDGADLRLAKSKSPNPVAQGSQVTSTITVTNGGPRRATGPLRVVDQLSGETYVSVSGTGWICSASGSTVTCDHANAAGLNAGASLPTLTIITTATVAGSATNQACTGSSLPAGAAAGTNALEPDQGDPNPTNDCNSASTSSTSVRPDLAITKTTSTPTGGDKIVSATEDSVTYTLVVTNVSPTAENATGVRISDTVPAFITSGTYQSSIVTPVVATVAGAGSTATFNCTVNNRETVICTQTGGVLAQGGTVTVPITVRRGMREGDFTNSGVVENTVEGDPDRSNNTASDTVTIAPLADMNMTGKSVTPGTVKAGEVATYVLSFRNDGPSTAQNVVVTDIFTFPAGDTGYTVTQITPSKGSCAFNAGINPNGVGVDDVLGPARNSFTCQIGSMASGETQTVTLKGRPNFRSGNAARVFTNVADVTTTTAERPDGTDGGNNAQGPVTLNVDPASLDLLVNKDDTGFDPIAFTSGSTFLSYRVNATNNGPSYATGVKITETMTPPAGKRIRFVCDTTTFGGSTCNTGPLALCSVSDVTSGVGTAIPAFTCDVPPGNATTGLGKGDLAIGQTKSIFLRFEVLDNPSTTGDTFTNQAIVSANEPDTLAANDTESEQTTVRRRVDLAVTKAAKKAGAPITTVALREPFDWEVIVTNNGPSESLQTILTDTLPAGSDLVGVISWTKTLPAATGTCPDSGVCTMGQLDAGGQITITVPSRLSAYPSGGVATNSATVNTDPTNLGGIDTTPLDNTATANVNVTRASIAGTVFQDRVRDGANGGTPQAAAQEPRIQGVTLTLTGNDLFGDPVNATATTDANGDYLFNNLPPSSTGGVGGYTITQTQPAGFINGPVDPPTAGGSEPSNGGPYTRGGTSGNSLFANIVVDGDDAAIRYHFPEIKQPSLSGFVYLDVNANDVRDPATDTPIAGATLRLLNATTLAQIATTTTGADGAYAFTGLDPLVAYTLEQPLPTTPANLRNGAVNPGQIGGAACTTGCTAQPNTPAADTDRIAGVDLASGTDGTVFNFGERQLAGVSGLVYVDKNRNNALDGSDTGRLAGVTVRLVQGASCAAGTELQTTTTAADGTYSFSGVLAFQNYLICETQPVGYAVGNANGTAGSNQITLTNLAAAGSANNNFGALVGSLSGSVYVDFSSATPANTNNGIRDAGEAGIAGVTVTLTGTDAAGGAVNRTATTDASGNYSFDDLLAAGAGGYTLTEGAIPPSAGSFNDGKTTAGGTGGTATAVNALPSAISGIALGAGVQTTNYIFGELPRAGITGTVYTDRNRNDTMEALPTDGRIAGVTLTLRQGASCSAGTVLGTTTTDANGQYAFNDLSAGLDYAICETQPTGYADGTVNPGTSGTSSAANSITLTNLPSAGSTDNHFGERIGSLLGAVYMDTDNDGQQDAGEAALAGVTVTLTGTDATGTVVSRSAITDTAGAYRFDDLLASGVGGYTVTEQATQPVFEGKATINGRTTAGSTGGTATTVTTLPSAIAAITLAAGIDATANNFGELLSVGLSGAVFADLANDGVQQLPADLGLAGVTLDLTGTDDLGAAVSATTTTAADGTYSFTGLRPGTYTVTEPTQPVGTVNGITSAGSTGGTATPVATLPSVISAIPLVTSGAFSSGNNFAEIPNNSGIGGRVWLDADNDGVIDASESGIAGVTVTLTGTDTIGRPVERTLTTDAQGGYLFENLAPGSYTVTEPTQPAGTLNGRTNTGNGGGTATPVATLPSAVSGITLGIGQMFTANDFGEIPPARIAGRVYADNNDNGVIDSSEVGLAGVSLVLTGADDLGAAVSVTLSSGADGGYAFENLRPGTYTVTEPTQPAGTVNGLTTAGTLGGTATPVATRPSAISGIVLPVGGAATGNNFGELAQSPDLRVIKTHAEPVFTVTKPATYSIRVLNLGEIATNGPYTIEDRLPAGLTLTSTPTGAGWSCTGAAGASSFSCTASTVVAAGATNPNAITAVAIVGPAALNAPIANNAVLVEGGGEIPARRPTPAERDAFTNNPGALPECTAAPPRNACRDPEDVQQSANLAGTVWYDIGTVQRQLDARDRLKQGWIVEVIDVTGADPSRPNAAGERVSASSAAGGDGDARATAGGTPGAVVARAFTNADGTYLIENLIPNIDYAVRFRDPNSNVVFGYPVNGERGPGSSGASCLALNKPVNLESSCVDTGAAPQLAVRLAPGRNLVQQSLPIDPTGVVYDSGLRTPVPGATVTFAPVGTCAGWDPTDDIVGATLGGYSVSGNAISKVTGADGLYQFLLSPSAPARCTFALTVTPPSGYSFISKLITPTPGTLSPPGGPGSFFNVQPQAEAPTGPVGPATTYYLSLSAGSTAPNILRNHIPLDPALPGTVLLDKTGDRSVVEVGDSVRYSITVSVPSGALPRQTTVVDRLPAGFTYIPGTAIVGDRPIADPQGGVGPTLAFDLGRMGDTRQLVLRYRVRVGVGAQEGDGVNRAQAQSCGVPTGCVDGGFNPLPGSVATNEDRYRVRVTGGVFGTEACVLGKVFVDCNNNHVQDREEIGIPGVRMVMSDGTTLISDSEGKYSVCGLEPKSTVMRIDPRTLPRGARMTTSSNRNLGDAGSLWLDLKNGELHRADFIEGSCSAPVIDQVKGRRAQGETRAPETERPDGPALRFESGGPVIGPVRPREGERVTPVDAQRGGAHGTP
jgi:uncharacterized repeat protein (TIGR01451 family)